MIKHRFFGASLALLATVSVCAPTAWAQKATAKPPTKATAKLPTAASILDANQKATGSKAAFADMKSIQMLGTFEVAGQKITGKLETRIKFPDKIYSSQEIAGFGKAEKGFDGKVGWSRDPLKGLQNITGAELKQLKAQGDDLKSPDWRKAYKKVEMLGVRKVGAAQTYAIRLTPTSGGRPLVNYYDTQSKLPVRTDVVLDTAEGSTPTQSFSSDFRPVNGILFPFKMRQVVNGIQEINIAFTAIRLNPPMEDASFAKPAEALPKPATP